MIKKAAKQLIKADKVRFNSVGFEENKKALGKNNLPSKSTRNKIAGYIGRMNIIERDLAVKEAKKKARETMASQEMPQYEQY